MQWSSQVDFLAKFLNWDGNEPHILINQQLALRWHCGGGRIFFKHLVVLFVIKQTVEWKEKKSYTFLHWCCFKTALPTSINFVYVKLHNLSLTLNLPKVKVNLIDKSPGLLSLPFQHSRCLKKKLDPPPRKAYLRVELEGYGYSLLQFP